MQPVGGPRLHCIAEADVEVQEFLERILPPTGPYYTARIKNKHIRQSTSTTLSDAEQHINQAVKSRHDVYIATGSFDGARTVAACTGKRALYVDIDCKVGGQYVNKKDAIEALKGALIRGLPRPSLIIDSGGGFHFYWVLTTTLLKSEWVELAQALVYACAECKLNIDKGITTDAARIMRVPGTTNFKDPQNPKPCVVKSHSGPDYDPEDLASLLNGFRREPVSPLAPAVDADDLSGGLSSAGREPPPAAPMLEGCPLFAENMVTGGASTPGIIWHKLIHTLAYTADGADYIHEISRGHADYTPHTTEARWAHALRQKERDGMGATKCATFAEAGATQCATCPMRDKGKSPIALSFRSSVTQPTDLPFPFRNTPTGVEKYDADSEAWEPVLPECITHFKATNDPGVTTHIEFLYGSQKVQMELSDLGNAQLTHGALGRFGLHLTRYQIEQINMVTHSFMQELRRAGKLSPPIQTYGWVAGGFHAGGVVYGAKSHEGTIRVDPSIAAAYEPCGTLEVWSECANHILQQDRRAAWAVLASAFASPLMTFTGAEGSLLSIVSSGSGTGKSTALKVAQAVWGDPKDGIAHLNDTTNSVANRLGVLNNLPSYWDEVRGKEDVTNFVKLIFRLSQGKDKQRLNSNITQRKAGRWSTMMTIATNEPIREHIARTVGNSDAGAARVFEIYADAINDDTMSDGQARAFYHRLGSNFGKAGEVYAAYLGNHEKDVKALIAKIDDAICRKLNTTGDERYWVATVSTLLAGATMANKLGLAAFDLAAFRTYLLEQFAAMRTYKQTEFTTGYNRAVLMLNRYLLEKADHVMFADQIPRPGVATKFGFRQDSMRKPTLIRIAKKDRAMRLVLQDFTNWVYENEGAGVHEITSELIAHGATKIRGSVDTGSPSSTGARYMCLDVPFKGEFAALADVCDEDTDNSDLGA